MGESISPFLFEGKAVDFAIADFYGNGRSGWAMWVIPDADYFFAVTTYDPVSKRWTETSITANYLDAMVEASPGKILVPICDAGGPAAHPTANLYFDVYRVKHGRFERDDKRVRADSAPAAERSKCARSAQ